MLCTGGCEVTFTGLTVVVCLLAVVCFGYLTGKAVQGSRRRAAVSSEDTSEHTAVVPPAWLGGDLHPSLKDSVPSDASSLPM